MNSLAQLVAVIYFMSQQTQILSVIIWMLVSNLYQIQCIVKDVPV